MMIEPSGGGASLTREHNHDDDARDDDARDDEGDDRDQGTRFGRQARCRYSDS